VRDDRAAADDAPAAVWFAYSEYRKGEHPKQHLSSFSGILQADGYAGFHHLYEGGRIVEAACWARVRRKFYDIHVANGSSIAAEAVKRIAPSMTSSAKFAAGLPRSGPRPGRHALVLYSMNFIAG
jgi:transposase